MINRTEETYHVTQNMLRNLRDKKTRCTECNIEIKRKDSKRYFVKVLCKTCYHDAIKYSKHRSAIVRGSELSPYDIPMPIAKLYHEIKIAESLLANGRRLK